MSAHTLARFSILKTIRGLAPTILMCGGLVVLLTGPITEIWLEGLQVRSRLPATVAVLASYGMLAFIALQVIAILLKRGQGVAIEGDRLVFFDWKYSTVPLSAIKEVAVGRVGAPKRVVLGLRSGGQKTVLANMMAGPPEAIADSIRRVVSNASPSA